MEFLSALISTGGVAGGGGMALTSLFIWVSKSMKRQRMDFEKEIEKLKSEHFSAFNSYKQDSKANMIELKEYMKELLTNRDKVLTAESRVSDEKLASIHSKIDDLDRRFEAIEHVIWSRSKGSTEATY